jgi:sporulation protein YlmC with PRC-barrel domain
MDVSQLKRQPRMATAAAIVLALGSGIQAQQEPVRENANRPQTDQSAQIARSDSGMQSLEQFLQGKSMRVSTLAGMELQARNGDNLGEVEDVLRSGAPGQDMQLVVKIGGIGAEEKRIAIPFDEVQIGADGDELYTNRTSEQLAAAPVVQLERPAVSTASNAERGAADANRDAADRGATTESGSRTAPPAAPGAAAQRGAASPSSAQQRMADLVGVEVVGSSGDQVGEVDDIVISTAGADSVRAVLQIGGVAGVGEKRVALPLSQVTVDRATDGEPTVRVAMDQAALERLPEFEYEEQTSAL